MPRVEWPLRRGRPCVEVVLTQASNGQPRPRLLLADTGAGPTPSTFELLLRTTDCVDCGGILIQSVALGGAYRGAFPVYRIPVDVPALGVRRVLRAVGVSTPPAGFDGIACFSLLNQFTYGNFGDPDKFGLEL